MTAIPRCDLSELPVDQCACRIHKPGQEADTRTPKADRTVGAPIAARYRGHCPECGESVQVGDAVRPVTASHGGTCWMHAECID